MEPITTPGLPAPYKLTGRVIRDATGTPFAWIGEIDNDVLTWDLRELVGQPIHNTDRKRTAVMLTASPQLLTAAKAAVAAFEDILTDGEVDDAESDRIEAMCWNVLTDLNAAIETAEGEKTK